MIAQAPVRHYASIDSTNTEARRLFEAGERGPVFLLADEQQAGRGRLDRAWVSPPGNCYSTLLMAVDAPLAAVPQIGFAVALAVADVVEAETSAAPHLKWPNDVLVDGAKISGILCDVVSATPLAVAVGCGINVAHAPEGLPYPATCLAALGSLANRDAVFDAYRQRLAFWLHTWSGGRGFDSLRSAWAARAIGIGEAVEFIAATHTIRGILDGIDGQGAVIIRAADGQRHAGMAGDLRIPALQKLREQ